MGRYVLVTTVHRGVFAGYADGDTSGSTVVLRDGRNCFYWSSGMKGFLGLASVGPDKDCKVGPKVPRLELRNITSVSDVTPEAAERWESSLWTS